MPSRGGAVVFGGRDSLKKAAFSYLLVTLMHVCVCAAEFRVNTRVANHEEDAAIAMDANENFVVVWKSYLQDGSSWGIFGQRFDRNCEAVGDEFQINTTTTGNQKEPAVAMDVGGNFVVVWHGPGVSEEDIFARRFDANGQPVGDEFRVNTRTNSRQLCPSVAMNNDGDFVIVWESVDVPEVGKRTICGQLYDRSGSSVGGELTIGDEPSVCRYPDVVIDNTGTIVVVWTGESSLSSVRVRHFKADGNEPLTSKKVSDTGFTSLTRPAVAIDANGYYVIAWDGHPDSYLEDDVYLKRYHWSHIALHEQFVVNTYMSGAQSNPCVAMDDGGQFLVVWESDTNSESTKTDIFGQRFPSQGEHIGEPILMGDQFRINTYTAEEQGYPAAAMGNDGRFISVWESFGQDGSGYGVFGEIGPKAGSADIDDDGFVDFGDYCVLGEEWRKEENPLEADLIDDNKIDELDLAAFCGQWLRLCYECSEVDIYTDGKIDFKDYAVWAANRAKQGPNLDGDITGNGIVDMADLKAVVSDWLDNCQ